MSRVFVFHRNASAALRLIVFPYAGGTPTVYRHWHTYLPSEVELAAVQLPGRGLPLNEPLLDEWRVVISDVSTALATVLDRPFIFFGHSLGALVAFEVARWLRRHAGIQPVKLLMSGRRAPQLPDDLAVSDASNEALIAHLRELDGTPAEVLDDPELFAVVAPGLRADFRLVERYRYTSEPPFACPIVAFGGREDDETAEGRLDAWRIHSCAPFASFVLPGGHFFLHSRERELLRLIRSELTCEPESARARMEPR